jgi:ankyrin repeat protein
MLPLFKKLPTEIKVHIYEYLPVEKAVELLFGVKCDSSKLEIIHILAIDDGNLNFLKWLDRMDYQYQGYEKLADHAAKKGRLEIIKYFHLHRTDEFTKNTFNLAAENGHLDVVKWLHENRTEGCTTCAMDRAARNGHLDVVKLLHENRTEGCTADAMNLAAESGHSRMAS